MVPQDAVGQCTGDRTPRVACVRAEHEAAPAGDELLMHSRGLPRVAAVITKDKSDAGIPGPKLEPSPHHNPLRRIAASQRQRRTHFIEQGSRHRSSSTRAVEIWRNSDTLRAERTRLRGSGPSQNVQGGMRDWPL